MVPIVDRKEFKSSWSWSYRCGRFVRPGFQHWTQVLWNSSKCYNYRTPSSASVSWFPFPCPVTRANAAEDAHYYFNTMLRKPAFFVCTVPKASPANVFILVNEFQFLTCFSVSLVENCGGLLKNAPFKFVCGQNKNCLVS